MSLKTFNIRINGETRGVNAEADDPLITTLRNKLGILSVRYGCGSEDCGACRILVEEKTAYSCSLTLGEIEGKEISTIEGLQTDPRDSLCTLQNAFLDLNAGQCGYCLSGILVTASRLLNETTLKEKKVPSRKQIQHALDGHLCRCGAHNRIIKAIQQAGAQLAGEG